MSTPPTAIDPTPNPDVAPSDRYRAGALIALLRLHWFIHLRWLMLATAFAALLVERMVTPQTQRPLGLIVTLLLLAGVNATWMGISRSLTKRLTESEEAGARDIRNALIFSNLQLAVDLLALTLILRYTGGVESPMAIFYLFHMAIGSLLLRSWQAALQGVWAVALYAAIGFGELVGWIAPHYHFLPTLSAVDLHSHPEYVASAILVQACGVFGILFFLLRVAARLDERERQLRHAHHALQQSQTAIFDLQERKSRFMQTAAHQLKGPLAGIQTLTSLILDGILPENTINETCEKIIRRCRDGIAQVTEMLTLARIEQADPSKHRNAVSDVPEVLDKLYQQYKLQAEEKDITFSLTCEPSPNSGLHARVDPQDLADCVANLIENAIKYTPAQGTVTVTATQGSVSTATNGKGRRPREQVVVVMVKDTGMGIEPTALMGNEGHAGDGSIFDAFRRGKGALANCIPGTGLGLSIVREVVEKAGGRIKAHSRPGHGSSFTVMFPAKRPVGIGPVIPNTRASEIVIDNQATDGKK